MTGTVEHIDIEDLQKSALKASGLLKVLSNPDRMLLLCQLGQGEHCVSDLEAETGIRQPTLSQQLTILREEQMVNTRREGKQIFYSIASQEAVAVLQLLHKLYCDPKKSQKGAKK